MRVPITTHNERSASNLQGPHPRIEYEQLPFVDGDRRTMKQRRADTDASFERMAAVYPQVHHPDSMIGGAKLPALLRGWAINRSSVAHYWRRLDGSRFRSLCRVEAHGFWMFERGSYPRCSHCQRAAKVHGLPTMFEFLE